LAIISSAAASCTNGQASAHSCAIAAFAPDIAVIRLIEAGVVSRQLPGGGAKKQRRDPSCRLQRQKAPSGLGWASLNGTISCPYRL